MVPRSISCLLVFLLIFPVFGEETTPTVHSVSVPGTNLDVKLTTQVGQPFDEKTVQKDVHYLWNTGRFDDVRAERNDENGQVDVVFHVVPKPHLFLHEIRLEPNTFGVELKLPPHSPIDELRAHEIARDAEKQLAARGYANAKVTERMVPAGNEVDLKLHVDTGDALRVKEIRFVGGDPKLRKELRALRTHTIIPRIPGIWDGWRLLPSYSQEAADADAGRIRSSYLLKGFLDADVRPGEVEVLNKKDARVTFHVQPGPQYPMPKDLCSSLFAERREAQKTGVLEFTTHFDLQHGKKVELGPKYRVGRIEFYGNHHYSDSALRRNFLLNEGDIFDELMLRRSVARLNRMGLFENIDDRNVIVHPDPQTGFASVTVNVTERKRGAWAISGPVGPMSLAGPLTGSISTRLPAWGRGLLELSTYTASFSVFAFATPLVPILNAPKAFTPIFALQRSFLPGEGWKSGFFIAPQLGWANMGLGYASAQLQGRLLPLLAGERVRQPELLVTVERPSGGEAIMFCEPPKPKLGAFRAAAAVGLHFLGALPAF